ncbi:MAG: hypothetical protein RIT45_1845 [Pseudomonadota bacterium]
MESAGVAVRCRPRHVAAEEATIGVRPPFERLVVASRLILAGFAVVAATACSGSVAKRAEPTPAASDAGAWRQRLERDARMGRHAEVVADVRALVAVGAADARALALGVAAHYGLGRPEQARAALPDLLRAAGNDPAGVRAVETLLHHQLDASRDLTGAAQLARGQWPGGCSGEAACAVASRMLAVYPAAPAAWRALAEGIAPVEADARQRFFLELARALAERRAFALHDAAIAVAQTVNPASAEVWAARFAATARQRGPEPRRRWLAALREARLPIERLRAIADHSQVLRDRLMVAEVLWLIADRPDSTAADWLSLVRTLGVNQQRGDTDRGRERLLRVAEAHLSRFDRDVARLALVEALLHARESERAHAILRPILARDPVPPLALVMEAERLRQAGEKETARELAERAVGQQPELARRVHDFWQASWPEGAVAFAERAANAPVDAATRVDAALQLLVAYQPMHRDTERLRATADALDEALRLAPSAERGALIARRRLLVDGLVRGALRSSWRETASEVAGILCRAPSADAATCEAAAGLAYRSRQPTAGLAHWRRARSLAAAQAVPLRPYVVLQHVVEHPNGEALVRFLDAAPQIDAPDGALATRIARVLMHSGRVVLARTWVDRCLARKGAPGALMETLPPLFRVGERGEREADVEVADLDYFARHGAADLVLERVVELRDAAARSGQVAEAKRLHRVQIVALASLGRGPEANAELERLGLRPDNNAGDGHANFQLATRLGLCGAVLELAEERLSRQRLPQLETVVRETVRCAVALRDGNRLLHLLDVAQRNQIARESQNRVARVLNAQQLHTLAAGWYARLLADPTIEADVKDLLAWSEALMVLGRPADADEALTRMTKRLRGGALAMNVTRAVELLRRHGREEAAVDLLGRILEKHGQLLDLHRMRASLALQLGQEGPFLLSLRALVVGGMDREQVASFAKLAERAHQLPLLHAGLQQLVDVDRGVEHARLKVAAAVGDREAMQASITRLRSRAGTIEPGEAQLVATHGGAWQLGRQLAAERLAAGQSDGSSDTDEALQAAAALRRDPGSRAELVATARLALAVASDVSASASAAAERLSAGGATEEAAAFAGFAAESRWSPEAANRAAEAEWVAGKHDAALARWRDLIARGLAQPSRSGDLSKRYGAILHRLLSRAMAIQRLPEVIGWMEAWLEVHPNDATLRQLFFRALASLGLYEQAGRIWSEGLTTYLPDGEAMRAVPAVGDGIARGAGEALSREATAAVPAIAIEGGHAGGVLRALEPDPERPLPPETARAAGSLRKAMAAHPAGRIDLARHESTLGRGARALQALGPAPFAGLQRGPGAAATRARQVAATAAAALLAHVFEPSAGAADRGAAPLEDWQRIADIVDGWRRAGTGVDDLVRIAGALARQGAPRLGERMLASLRPLEGPFPLESDALEDGMRVCVAVGDHESALLWATRRVERVDGVPTREETRAVAALVLAATGAPWLAEKLVAQRGRAVPAPSIWSLPGDGSDAPLLIRLRRFDRDALDDALRLERPHSRVVHAAVALALATRRVDAAEQLAERGRASHDEPWHLGARLIREAMRWGERELAARWIADFGAKAPRDVFACPALALQAPGATLSRCVRGRRLATLPADDLQAVLAAACRAASAADEVLAGLGAGFDADVLQLALRLLSDLTSAQPQLRDRAHGLGVRLLALAEADYAKTAVLTVGTEALEPIGLASEATRISAQALRRMPHDAGALNNHAYGIVVVGGDATKAEAMAMRALRFADGGSAAALLDTLGAIALAQGHVEQAWTWLRAASAAQIGVSLVEARLAQVLLTLGRRDQARQLAAVVLRYGSDEDLVAARMARGVLFASLAPRPEPAVSVQRR